MFLFDTCTLFCFQTSYLQEPHRLRLVGRARLCAPRARALSTICGCFKPCATDASAALVRMAHALIRSTASAPHGRGARMHRSARRASGIRAVLAVCMPATATPLLPWCNSFNPVPSTLTGEKFSKNFIRCMHI